MCCWRGTRLLGAFLGDRGPAEGAGSSPPPRVCRLRPLRSFFSFPSRGKSSKLLFRAVPLPDSPTQGQGPWSTVPIPRMSRSVCPLHAVSRWDTFKASHDCTFSLRCMACLRGHLPAWRGLCLSRDYPLCGRQNSPRSPRLPATPQDSSPARSPGLGLWLDFSVTRPLQTAMGFKGGRWSGRASLTQDPFRGPSCRQLPARPASQSFCTREGFGRRTSPWLKRGWEGAGERSLVWPAGTAAGNRGRRACSHGA